ncbi:MAG: alpha/beta hydrolase fold domain-containing protein [Rhodobacteraceae bacterium]|nr:alpha/beta hydrolase fold domain-containing protein [Paracoccaceae bacterium]
MKYGKFCTFGSNLQLNFGKFEWVFCYCHSRAGESATNRTHKLGKLKKIRRLISALMPEKVVTKLNPHRPVYRGAMIDAKAFAAGQLIKVMRPAGKIPTPEEGRKTLREVASKFDIQVRLDRIEDLGVAGENGALKARLYSDSDKNVNPTMVFFHGGGFVQGDIESHHYTCAKLAKFASLIRHSYPARAANCTKPLPSEANCSLGIMWVPQSHPAWLTLVRMI